MPNYAISDGSKIVNVIVADSKEIAESVSEMSAIETNGDPWIDWELYNNKWRSPSPFPSWQWNDSSWSWQPPIERPEPTEEYGWVWNENLLNWEKKYR